MLSRKQYRADFEEIQLRNDGTTSHLSSNTRIALATTNIKDDRVKMSLWYSRMSTSEEDFSNFFGFSPYKRAIPQVEYQFDSMIAEEMESLQPLPRPLALAYDICKTNSVSQKKAPNAVRVQRSEFPTNVPGDNPNVPLVLLGDAAHAIPSEISSADINTAMMDAHDLCCMIVERYDNDSLFSRIPEDYYDFKFRSWHNLHLAWEARWMTAHGLPYDSTCAGNRWVKLRGTARLPQQNIGGELKGFPDGDRQRLQRYRYRESARWHQAQQLSRRTSGL